MQQIVPPIFFPLSNYIPPTFSKTHSWIYLLKTLHQFCIKTVFFSALHQDGEGTTEPYIAEINVCNDENGCDYEPAEPVMDPDKIPERFGISPVRFCITKTKAENSAPRSLSKKCKRGKIGLKLSFAPGQGTDLIRLLSSSESFAKDDKDQTVKIYEANNLLCRFLFFSIYNLL